jgi:hypothetical protein
MESNAVEALVQYIWNIESHHWTCTTCHRLSEIEIEGGIKLPENPHLRSLRRRRKEMLRRQLVEEGKRVGGIREENEVLTSLLQQDDTGTAAASSHDHASGHDYGETQLDSHPHDVNQEYVSSHEYGD